MSKPVNERQRHAFVGGAILILIGLLAFGTQFIRSEWAGLIVLGGLAVIFIVGSVVAHNPALMVPGGVLAGVALGVALSSGQLTFFSGERQGAAMVLSLAAGFALIAALVALFFQRIWWWALIVAGILALAGGALWVGGAGAQLLELAGRLWWLILIGIGGWLIWRGWRRGNIQS